ncbi:Cyclin-L1 [Nymphon striatum]|nr:Cyclin-L1 [Nymphon striatum]
MDEITKFYNIRRIRCLKTTSPIRSRGRGNGRIGRKLTRETAAYAEELRVYTKNCKVGRGHNWLDDKRQITEISKSGNLLHLQPIYQGKTIGCHPNYRFPHNCHAVWNFSCGSLGLELLNNLAFRKQAGALKLQYLIMSIILPAYVDDQHENLDLHIRQKGLVIMYIYRAHQSAPVIQGMESYPVPLNMEYWLKLIRSITSKVQRTYIEALIREKKWDLQEGDMVNVVKAVEKGLRGGLDDLGQLDKIQISEHSLEWLILRSIILSTFGLFDSKKIPLPNKPAWYLLFDATGEQVQKISRKILQLYSRLKPNLEKLEKIVNDIKAEQQQTKMKMKGLSGTNTPTTQGFSPGSRQGSPKINNIDNEKKELKNETSVNGNGLNSKDVSNHAPAKHDNSRSSSESSKERKDRSRSSSLTPRKRKKYEISPPRSYKEHRHHHRQRKSRSRSREKKENRHKMEKKRHRSRSVSISPPYKKSKEYRNRHKSRSYSRSPVRHEKSRRTSRKERSRDHRRSDSRERSRR